MGGKVYPLGGGKEQNPRGPVAIGLGVERKNPLYLARQDSVQ